MAIQVTTVQGCVQGGGANHLLVYAGYITQVVNIYCASDPEREQMLEQIILPEAVFNAGGSTATIQGIVDAIYDGCESWDSFFPNHSTLRAQAANVPVPVVAPPVPQIPAAPVNYYEQHAQDVQRLNTARTTGATAHGKRLVEAAARLTGFFHWVKSGPVDPSTPFKSGVERFRAGMSYGPKAYWKRTFTDFSGGTWDSHEEKINHFALWVSGRSPFVPGRNSYMNCWEAVFIAAFEAQLVTFSWLLNLHRQAQTAFRNSKNGKEYFNILLYQGLGYQASVPFEPRAGLIPRSGDLMFWDGNEHVAISLGRRWTATGPEDHLMSLWSQPRNEFMRITLDDFPRHMQKFTFRPCPF